MRRLFLGTILSLVTVVLLAACGGQASPAPSPSASPSVKASGSPSSSSAASTAPANPMDEIYAKAKQEGKVVVYTAWGDVSIAPVKQAFAKMYPGVNLEFLTVAGAEGVTKVESEQTAGKYVADAYTSGSPSTRQLSTKGFVERYDPPALKEPGLQLRFDANIDKDGPLIYGGDGAFIVVNKNMVPEGQEPKSWKELEDPKWKGKILLQNPSTSGPGNRWFASLYEVQGFGDAHLRKVIQNAFIYKGDFAGLFTEVARGEYPVGVPAMGSLYGPILAQGAPLRVVDPSEGAMMVLNQVVLLKNAPHPNAAKLFFNFIFTKEGQATIAEMGGTPVRKDVDPKFKEFQMTKLLPGQPSTKEWETKNYVEARAIATKTLQELGK